MNLYKMVELLHRESKLLEVNGTIVYIYMVSHRHIYGISPQTVKNNF